MGDFWKHHGAAALASTTEERDHHITLGDQAHSRYQQFVQEEVTKRKTEENTIEVLKLCKEADNLSSMRDYHAAEQCYLHALKILPEHAQSLCNYSILARKNWTRLKNCLRKLSRQNLTVHQRYSTTLHIFLRVDRCERVVICIHVRASWNPHTLGYKNMDIFSRMQRSKPDMYRQRLKLSPAGIYKRLYQKRAPSTG